MIPCRATLTYEVDATDEAAAKAEALADLRANGSKYATGVSADEPDLDHVEVEEA